MSHAKTSQLRPARTRGRAAAKRFDKYDLYTRSVQQPDEDAKFFRDTYKELKGSAPKVLREDFCGAFAVCTEWVKLGKDWEAHGVDLDPEPIQYGRERWLTPLKEEQKSRVHIHEKNVLDPALPKADIVAALNFSFFIFKKRSELKDSFQRVYEGLEEGGIFVTDCFGGSDCQGEAEDVHDHDDFTYYWEQASFDPVTYNAQFHIHFKPKHGKKLEKVFSYDWRMWTIPEIKDIMEEVGFRRSHVYWEGTEEDSGEGDGNFSRVEEGEECDSWISFIVGEK